MEEKTVKLNIDVEESIQGLKDLKKQLKTVAAGSDEFKQLHGAIDDLEDKIASAKATSSDWIDSMADAGGVLGVVGNAINSVKVSTQTFSGALKATGIGIVVALLGGLVAAFSENDNMMKKMQPIMNAMSKVFQGIFKAVEPLVDILINMALKALPMVMDAVGEVYSYVSALAESFGAIGKAISKLIQGDFKGAWESAKSSVTDFSKHHNEAKKRYISGTEEMTAADKEAAEKAAELREKEQAKKDAAAAKQKAAEEKEAAERKAAREKEMAEINAASDEINESLAKGDKKRREDKLTAEDKDRKDFLTRSLDFAIQKKNLTDQEIAEAAAAEQAKIDIRNKGLDNLSAGLEVLKSVFGKNKELQKGLLVAEAAVNIARIISNTQVGNAKTVAALGPAAAPFVIANNVGMGISIAATIAATAKGLSALGGGSAPNAGSTPSSSTGGGAPTFNVIGANPSNQLAQSLGNKENQVVKAYVVAGEVTTAQNLNKNIITTASMG